MRKMVLIDLDHTLVDESYQLTDESVKDTIKQLRDQGWEIGLTANAPLKTQLVRWNQLSLNGPIVVERGAAVYWHEDDAYIRFTKAQPVVREAKANIFNHIRDLSDTLLVHGDATTFIRTVHEIPGCLNASLIALNGLREFSIAFHVRRIERGSGKLIIDLDLFNRMIRDLHDYFPVSECFSGGVLDNSYGFFHLDPTDVTKAESTAKVFEDAKVDRRIVIGDHIEDFVEGAEVLAVGNASDDLKVKANKIAESTYTNGVKELLESLVE